MDLAWLAVVPAYLLGTFPTAILVGRREGRDPTIEGSGNPGASNALRTMGRRAAALVLVGDVGKGAVAAAAGWAMVHGLSHLLLDGHFAGRDRSSFVRDVLASVRFSAPRRR